MLRIFILPGRHPHLLPPSPFPPPPPARFADEEIDWSDAREKLKRARLQLDELDHDAETGAHDSATFFEKVDQIKSVIFGFLSSRARSIFPLAAVAFFSVAARMRC